MPTKLIKHGVMEMWRTRASSDEDILPARQKNGVQYAGHSYTLTADLGRVDIEFTSGIWRQNSITVTFIHDAISRLWHPVVEMHTAAGSIALMDIAEELPEVVEFALEEFDQVKNRFVLPRQQPRTA